MSTPTSSAAGPRFLLGRVVATPGALRLLGGHEDAAAELLARHVRGDWGDVGAADAAANDAALDEGGGLLSAYDLPDKGRIWIITEWDRSVTTLLLPQEY